MRLLKRTYIHHARKVYYPKDDLYEWLVTNGKYSNFFEFSRGVILLSTLSTAARTPEWQSGGYTQTGYLLSSRMDFTYKR